VRILGFLWILGMLVSHLFVGVPNPTTNGWVGIFGFWLFLVLGQAVWDMHGLLKAITGIMEQHKWDLRLEQSKREQFRGE